MNANKSSIESSMTLALAKLKKCEQQSKNLEDLKKILTKDLKPLIFSKDMTTQILSLEIFFNYLKRMSRVNNFFDQQKRIAYKEQFLNEIFLKLVRQKYIDTLLENLVKIDLEMMPSFSHTQFLTNFYRIICEFLGEECSSKFIPQQKFFLLIVNYVSAVYFQAGWADGVETKKNCEKKLKCCSLIQPLLISHGNLLEEYVLEDLAEVEFIDERHVNEKLKAAEIFAIILVREFGHQPEKKTSQTALKILRVLDFYGYNIGNLSVGIFVEKFSNKKDKLLELIHFLINSGTKGRFWIDGWVSDKFLWPIIAGYTDTDINMFVNRIALTWNSIDCAKNLILPQEKFYTFLFLKFLTLISSKTNLSETEDFNRFSCSIQDGIFKRLSQREQADNGPTENNTRELLCLLLLKRLAIISGFELNEEISHRQSELEQLDNDLCKNQYYPIFKSCKNFEKSHGEFQEELSSASVDNERSSDDSSDEEFVETNFVSRNTTAQFQDGEPLNKLDLDNEPKGILDCLLCLQSESKTRIELSLKALPKILIRQKSMVHPKAKELCESQLKTGNVYNIEFFDKLKNESVILLQFITPSTFSEVLFERFFTQESSIIEKLNLITTTSRAIQEILGSRKKMRFFDNLQKNISEEDSFILKSNQTDSDKKTDDIDSPFDFDIRTLYNDLGKTPENSIEAIHDHHIKLVQETRYHTESTTNPTPAKNSSKPNSSGQKLDQNLFKKSYTEKVIDRLRPLYFTIIIKFQHETKRGLKFLEYDKILLEKIFELMSTVILTTKNHNIWFSLCDSCVEFGQQCVPNTTFVIVLQSVMNMLITLCQNSNPNVIKNHEILCERIGVLVKNIAERCLREDAFFSLKGLAGFLINVYQEKIICYDINIQVSDF